MDNQQFVTEKVIFAVDSGTLLGAVAKQFSLPIETVQMIYARKSSIIARRLQDMPTLAEAEEKPCPYSGVAYSQVPGYVSGYGCPVCKGIGSNHLTVDALAEVDGVERD